MPPVMAFDCSSASSPLFAVPSHLILQGNPLLTNATDECNPELTAALLRQFADIEIHSTLVTVWVSAQSAE